MDEMQREKQTFSRPEDQETEAKEQTEPMQDISQNNKQGEDRSQENELPKSIECHTGCSTSKPVGDRTTPLG